MALAEATLSAVADEDLLRAQLYRTLAYYLRNAPDADSLAMAGALTGDGTELGKAISGMAVIAGKSNPEAIKQEYHDLFIGVGRGELLPYGSY